MVDWSEVSGDQNLVFGVDYTTAISNTKVTAQGVVDFIKKNSLTLANVYCVGHSLGAHVKLSLFLRNYRVMTKKG